MTIVFVVLQGMRVLCFESLNVFSFFLENSLKMNLRCDSVPLKLSRIKFEMK